MNRRNTPLLAGLAVVLCLGLFWVMDPSVEPEMAAAEDVPTRPLNHPPSAVRPTPAEEPVAEEGDQPWPEEGPPTEPEAVAAPEAPVTGSVWPISKDGIDGAIREIMHDIRGCYQDALADLPELEGGFKVRFTVEDVDGLGEVTAVEIRDMKSSTHPELVDGPMEDCVLDLFETLQFDVPEAGQTQVSYPFVFSRG